MIIKKKTIGPKFTMLRIAIFNSLLIDYLAISLRTLGHFYTEQTHLPLDHLSHFLAWFTLACFALELTYMGYLVNNPKFYNNIAPNQTEKELREVFFDGISEQKWKKSWFARNYNLFYLIRFILICMFIFNLQYLQIVQVGASLIVMATFCIMTFYQESKHKFFSSKFTKIFRLIQEVSMTIIVLLINIFCYDSFKRNLPNSYKMAMILVFVGLLVMNIFLEIVGCVINMVMVIKESWKNENKKKSKKVQK